MYLKRQKIKLKKEQESNLMYEETTKITFLDNSGICTYNNKVSSWVWGRLEINTLQQNPKIRAQGFVQRRTPSNVTVTHSETRRTYEY